MRLLFDQNLSHRLVRSLADVYPDALHVRDLGLKTASDPRIWDYAAHHDLIIVSKDSDFYERSLLAGCPPKLVWIASGNCSTRDIEVILRRHRQDLEALAEDAEAALLILA